MAPNSFVLGSSTRLSAMGETGPGTSVVGRRAGSARPSMRYIGVLLAISSYWRAWHGAPALTDIEGIGPEFCDPQSEALVAGRSCPAMTYVAEVFKEHVQHLVDDDSRSKVQGWKSSQSRWRIPESVTQVDRVRHASAEPGVGIRRAARWVVVCTASVRRPAMKDHAPPSVQFPCH